MPVLEQECESCTCFKTEMNDHIIFLILIALLSLKIIDLILELVRMTPEALPHLIYIVVY